MANKQTGSDDKSMPATSGQPALPSVGGERLSMSDYQTLTHLLERAGRESRLGEVLFYSGLTEKAQEQITQYDSKLKGKGPWVYEDGGQSQTTGQMVQTPTPKAKSVAKKGQDVLTTMGLAATVPSSSTSCPVQVPSLPLSGLQEPLMGVGKSGSVSMPSPPDLQQPSSSQGSDAANAQVGDNILRWKAKWGPTGTVRGVGYPVNPQDLSDGRQLRGVLPDRSPSPFAPGWSPTVKVSPDNPHEFVPIPLPPWLRPRDYTSKGDVVQPPLAYHPKTYFTIYLILDRGHPFVQPAIPIALTSTLTFPLSNSFPSSCGKNGMLS